jgi:hypothetical protein
VILTFVQGCSEDKPEKPQENTPKQMAPNAVKTEDQARDIAIRYITENRYVYVKNSIDARYEREANHWHVSFLAATNRSGATRLVVINAMDGKVIRFEGGE